MASLPAVSMLVFVLHASSVSRQAEEAFAQGREFMKQGRLEDACPLFEKSHELEPALGTLLNWATCLERQGKVARAYGLFNEAIPWASRTKKADREKFAVERSNALRARLAWVTVTAQVPLTGMTVTLGGQSWPLSHTPLVVPIDVGEHPLTVSAPEHEPWQTRVIARKSGETVNVTAWALTPMVPNYPLMPREPTEAVAEEKTHVAAAAPAQVLRTQNETPMNVAGVTTLSAGAVVAVAGAVGLIASHRWYLEFEPQRIGGPQENSPTAAREDFDRLRTLYTASWVGVGAGLAASAIGSYLLWTPTTTTPKVAVLPAQDGATVTFHSTF